MRAEDVPYLTECWVQTVSRATRCYAGYVKPQVKHRLASDTVLVAVLPDDLDAILGFAAVDLQGVTRMAYTRRTARNLGVQKAIFQTLKACA